MNFAEMHKAFKSIDLELMGAEAVEAEAAQVVDRNTAQLWSGVDATGKALPMPYHPRTIAEKKGKGQPTDRITLFDEGDLYKGTFVERKGKEIRIWSKDWKADKLVSEWGEIFGLTPESKEYLKPAFVEIITEKMRKKLSI